MLLTFLVLHRYIVGKQSNAVTGIFKRKLSPAMSVNHHCAASWKQGENEQSRVAGHSTTLP